MIMEIKRGVKIWAIYGPTDLRKQINGLSNIALLFEKKLYDGSHYVFCNRSMKAIKILYYDKKGFCIWHIKCEKKYRYFWPIFNEGVVAITRHELECILDCKDIWRKEKFRQKTEKQEQAEPKNTEPEKKKGGYNKVMIRPFPDKITLENVIKEREVGFNQEIISGFIHEDGAGTFYVDKKGLVHRDNPKGKIVSFVGWTNEQMKGGDGFAPMPN
jgi:transposase